MLKKANSKSHFVLCKNWNWKPNADPDLESDADVVL